MMGSLTSGAALLLGLAASGHCLVMCGGITTALGLATARDASGRVRPTLLLGYQLGRIVSYSIAGFLLAGVIGGVSDWLDFQAVSRALRVLSGFALLLGALIVFGRVRDPGLRAGQFVWRRLAPLGRRLLPVASVPRALAFGMVWGWMPCGFVYSILLIAALQSEAVQGAITMAAFGVGTAPALLVSAFGAQRLAGFASAPATRYVAGAVLLACAVLTLAGPWLAHSVFDVHVHLTAHGGQGN
jgi:sulfite exporter TauE/SafE